jgi:hypothetical protein
LNYNLYFQIKRVETALLALGEMGFTEQWMRTTGFRYVKLVVAEQRVRAGIDFCNYKF